MKKIKINGNSLLLVITIVLFVVMYAAGCIIYADKGFTHLQTFLNVLINNAGLLCVACGTTCVMLTGGIDISVGSLVAMDCMLLAVGMNIIDWHVLDTLNVSAVVIAAAAACVVSLLGGSALILRANVKN